ncbi:TonB-dependent receptor plug domain-containing protein [Arcobacter porcinus]|uniref:TonB-dependent receptor n=1 Tax=Arcobacter porcinus TaxID=1935204 RepID=A0A5C2HJX9_9BACT|nr:TonB-dependent receptor [Arcobacter porcinus]OCL96757.1 Vitamin B12 transporter BtuB precursor [Aliarcobacter thereius]QEP40588.1 TonB-dependent receptor [Arcobacter porcinus]
MKKINVSLVASFLLATNLYSQTTTLETITVTSATKSEQKLKDVTANVDVITAEDIEARKFKTVAEALNSLAGVSISSNGGIGQTSSVYLRGMDAHRVLILVDGVRFNDITTPKGSANIEHLMINDIDRIEVIKGAQSSIWGADSSAGVINIITKSAKDGTHGNASVEYGRYNSKTAKANISHKNENFDAKLGITRVDTNGFSAMAPKDKKAKDYEDDGYENTSANIKLGYNFNENNRLSTSYEIIDTKTDIDGYDIFDNPDPNNTDKAKTKTHLANLTYENRNDIALTKVYGNYTDIKRDSKSSFGTSNFRGKVKEYGLNTSIDYLNSSNVTIGADYKDFEDKEMSKDYDNKGIFISNTNKFFDDKTIFTQALRYDRYSDFENKTTGKIGIKQYIVDDLNISANYGTGYNVPTIGQLFGQYGANPDLNPEKTKTYDIGIEYKGFSATYFNSKIDNLIDWVVVTPPWNGVYDNIEGKSSFKGVELAYKNYVTEDIFLNLNYTRLSAKNDKDEYLARRAKNKFNFGVDYYGLKDFHFNINGEYIGTRYDGNNKQGAKTGNYTIWNAVVDYDISKNFSTYLKLDNIFNKDYQIVDGYATSQRAAYLGIKASF